jgi:divalent metal cation (Fe/Co/Zn/Cd) transporter
MLDGVEPDTVEQIGRAASHVEGVHKLVDVKARWLGHRLHADILIAVDDRLPLAAASKIAGALERELHAHMPAIAVANVRFSGQNEISPSAHFRHLRPGLPLEEHHH